MVVFTMEYIPEIKWITEEVKLKISIFYYFNVVPIYVSTAKMNYLFL